MFTSVRRESRMHKFKGSTNNPVRSSYFNGLPSISVAKWWITCEEVRVTNSSQEVIEI